MQSCQLPLAAFARFSHGILACKPGGHVVYTTSTLAGPQNDGTIERVLQRLWTETEVEVAVIDTSHLAQAFAQDFKFFTKCKYGQLVVPNLTANFGPTYFAKLQRLS